MKHYNVGRGYLVLTDASKYMANKIGKGNDEKVICRIYKEFRNRIKEKKFEYEYLGKRIVKVKKKYLDSLVEEFKTIFLDDYQLGLMVGDNEEKSKESVGKVNEENAEKFCSDNSYNLEFVKNLLLGKYDDIVDGEAKKKLVRQLIDDQ